MKHLTKKRELTEIQQLKKEFPNISEIPREVVTDPSGNILSIEIDDEKIIAWLKERGFEE